MFSVIFKLKSHYIILSVRLSQDVRYVEHIIMTKLYGLAILSYAVFNPLSPNSDQQQFSPNDIHTLSWDEVMRIN